MLPTASNCIGDSTSAAFNISLRSSCGVQQCTVHVEMVSQRLFLHSTDEHAATDEVWDCDLLWLAVEVPLETIPLFDGSQHVVLEERESGMS